MVLTAQVDWVRRNRGCLTFQLVQVLTADGFFAWPLHRITRWEPTVQSHYCDDHDEEDTADYTLALVLPKRSSALPSVRL